VTTHTKSDSFNKAGTFVELMIIVLTVAIAVIGVLCAGENPFDRRHLLLSDSLHVPEANRQARLDFLLNAVEHQHDIQVQVYVANESNRMQARLFFVTAFAAIAAVAFTIKEKKVRQMLAYAALLFTGLLYLLDVHMRDLSDRQVPIRDELRNTIVAITRVADDDSR
jgi:hypothetical protein